MSIQSLSSMQALSLMLLMLGIGLAFSHVRLSGWLLGWILLSGALLLQGFRSMLSYIAEHGGVDPVTYTKANDWMGLGFSLLVVAAMYMMREVFVQHRLAAESLRAVSVAAKDALIIMDRSGTITDWNLAAQRIFGYGEQEAQGKKLSELIMPESCRADFDSMLNHLGSEGVDLNGDTPVELAGVRKDGTGIVTEYSISCVTIDGKWHAIYIVRDITARKQAEVESRERNSALEMLSAKMLRGDEMEKKKLAFGLHEGLAQTLASIKMLVERYLARSAEDRTNDRSIHDESLASVVPLLQSAIKDVHIIATGLRPSSLDELGLLPTIEWYCREFDRLHPAISLEDEVLVQEGDVPVPLKVVIYRIVESAMTNIVRYENTDQIRLALRLQEGAITLAIDDTSQDSRYAATTERDADTNLQVHFGESQERTTLSGGTFTISRSKAGGVSLRASWAAASRAR